VTRRAAPLWEIFAAFLRLGCTAFGGPVAHIAYFHEEFVRRRKWLDHESYAHVVALCQLLPGPTSSQVGLIIGFLRGGWVGAMLAWLAFTLPSSIVLVALALNVLKLGVAITEAWVHGLLVAAVAVVAGAIATMSRALCPDRPRKIVALGAGCAAVAFPASSAVQLALIAIGATYGWFCIDVVSRGPKPLPIVISRTWALVCALVFCSLLVGLPLAPHVARNGPLGVFGAFFTAGALVFGGGHVVLPLLGTRVVPPGWVAPDVFIAGYAAAQAVPGPLFSFAAFLGAAMHGPVSGVSGVGGAVLALVAIYLPSFLLIGSVLPAWNGLAGRTSVLRALAGVNAIVVGLLLAALYEPLWVSAIRFPADVLLASLAFIMLKVMDWPPWVAVIFCAGAAQMLTSLAHVEV
jgi:chromate transporter